MNPVNNKVNPADVIPHDELMEVFKENRNNLIVAMNNDKTFVKNSLIVMKGTSLGAREETDHELLFRQESYFYYLFGVRDPDCYGVIHSDGKSVLFVPHLDDAWEMWIGPLLPPSHFKTFYHVDECYYVDEMESYLHNLHPEVIYINHGRNSDSGNYTPSVEFPGHENYRIDNGLLFYHLTYNRIHKNEKELKILRYACRLASIGHIGVMNACKPGIYEFQLESTFLHSTSINGESRYSAFTSICGSGRNASICHYGHSSLPNDKLINDGDIVVSDQGCLCYGYSSDITCTFPANGTFSPLQKNLYEAVLDMNWSVQDAMKPGVAWYDMHKLAYETGIKHMLKWGLIKGDHKELMDNNVCSIFMPHGLGHFMGVDTHDVGGYIKGFPERPKESGYCKLRTNCILSKGMLITVEPGLYFIPSLITKAKNTPNIAKYIDFTVLEQYFPVGGCRLEDDVLVTDTGVDCLTCLPRTVSDVEDFVQGKKHKLSEITDKRHYKGRLD